jgi:predicted enzyme related to lactoylglutathione lyase
MMLMTLRTVGARLVEAGARSVGEIIDFDGGQIVFARDPDGNLLGFQESRQPRVLLTEFADNGI